MRVALHALADGPVALGSTLAGTLDFRAARDAVAANPAAPHCDQVSFWAYAAQLCPPNSHMGDARAF